MKCRQCCGDLTARKNFSRMCCARGEILVDACAYGGAMTADFLRDGTENLSEFGVFPTGIFGHIEAFLNGVVAGRGPDDVGLVFSP
jgi:hypothetical protein